MIGKLTIDKASMNLSYFLYTIKIISDNNGRISRKEFGKQMGTFIGIPSVKGGKENRTPYNKSKLPRYFGFVDIEHGDGNEIFLVLTLIAITSCVDLSLNAGSNGASVGVGVSSKNGNIRWNQNLDLSN